MHFAALRGTNTPESVLWFSRRWLPETNFFRCLCIYICCWYLMFDEATANMTLTGVYVWFQLENKIDLNWHWNGVGVTFPLEEASLEVFVWSVRKVRKLESRVCIDQTQKKCVIEIASDLREVCWKDSRPVGRVLLCWKGLKGPASPFWNSSVSFQVASLDTLQKFLLCAVLFHASLVDVTIISSKKLQSVVENFNQL